MASPSWDHIHYFFAEAHVLTSEAKFVINALPNAEMRVVETLMTPAQTRMKLNILEIM
ncbi:hypothetical protein HHX47_DHR2000746 [Lentinula edodes]|nr:hypothetical protein HHX47_DHR2000746 [Lentinula edodes]